MRRVSRGLFVAAAFVALCMAAASAMPDTWARGTVTAMSPDSITLDVKGQAMTFKVTPATDVIARGAGTKAREAVKTTGEKPKFSDLLKVGDQVEVRYTEASGVMTADQIRAGISAGAMTSTEAAKGATKKAEGVVTAISAESISVKGTDGAEMTFAVDDTLRVIGRGLGTMEKEKEKAKPGKKLTLAEAVAVGDTVQIMYKEMGEMKHAAEVIVRKKGT